MWVFVNNFRSALVLWTKTRGCLHQTNHRGRRAADPPVFRSRPEAVPQPFRSRSARDLHQCRTSAEPVPHQCRTSAAPVPPQFRRGSAPHETAFATTHGCTVRCGGVCVCRSGKWEADPTEGDVVRGGSMIRYGF